jgi:polar amino acid transport system permease protein
MGYEFRFDVVIPWIPYFLGGLGVTILIAVLSMAAGAALGLLLATLRIARVPVLGTLAAGFIDVFRTTPALTQVLWVVYVVPIVIGYTPPSFWAGWLALTLNLSAFMAEIFRAGIESISRGQWEAAGALGMNRRRIYQRVILPQALRRVIPPTASMWVSLFRDTSILSLVGVAELFYRAREASYATYRPLEMFTFVAVLYVVICLPQARWADQLHHRLRVIE